MLTSSSAGSAVPRLLHALHPPPGCVWHVCAGRCVRRVLQDAHEAEDVASIAAVENQVLETSLGASQAANQAAAARLGLVRAAQKRSQEVAVQARQEVLALEGRVDAHERARSRGVSLSHAHRGCRIARCRPCARQELHRYRRPGAGRSVQPAHDCWAGMKRGLGRS